MTTSRSIFRFVAAMAICLLLLSSVQSYAMELVNGWQQGGICMCPVTTYQGCHCIIP